MKREMSCSPTIERLGQNVVCCEYAEFFHGQALEDGLDVFG